MILAEWSELIYILSLNVETRLHYYSPIFIAMMLSLSYLFSFSISSSESKQTV